MKKKAVDFLGRRLQSAEMSSEKTVDKLADGLKDLVIGASGNIPGYPHGISNPHTSEASTSVNGPEITIDF